SGGDLPDEQKAIVEPDSGKRADSVAPLGNTREEHVRPENPESGSLPRNRTGTAGATQARNAVGHDDAQRLQRTSARQNGLPFPDRNHKSAERPNIQPVPVGWRALVVEEHRSQEQFTKYFCATDKVGCVSEL